MRKRVFAFVTLLLIPIVGSCNESPTNNNTNGGEQPIAPPIGDNGQPPVTPPGDDNGGQPPVTPPIGNGEQPPVTPGDEPLPLSFSVTFYNNKADVVSMTIVDNGDLLVEPAIISFPNTNFLGWSTSNDSFHLFDFNAPIVAPLDLYAFYETITNPVLISYYFDLHHLDEPLIWYQEVSTIPTLKVATPFDNYRFVGWSTSSSNMADNMYTATAPLTDNISLYARYEIDQDKITRKAQQDVYGGVFLLATYYYNTVDHTPTGPYSYYHYQAGIASLIREDDNSYYVVAPYYVTRAYGNFVYSVRYVRDLDFNFIVATLCYTSASYGLAILSFPKTERIYPLVRLAPSFPNLDDEVVSIEASSYRSSLMHFGILDGMDEATSPEPDPNYSNVHFPLLRYRMSTTFTSWGNPILNASLQLVGIHFAYDESTGYGYAISISKIKEFLALYFID